MPTRRSGDRQIKSILLHVTAAEYAILAVGVVVIVGASAAVFGPQVKTAFTKVGTEIGTQQSAVSNAMK